MLIIGPAKLSVVTDAWKYLNGQIQGLLFQLKIQVNTLFALRRRYFCSQKIFREGWPRLIFCPVRLWQYLWINL